MVVENATVLINETLNQTVQPALPAPIDYAIHTAAPRISELILAPLNSPEMLWTLAPMMIALVLMQIYFGRNKDKALGWNTAFGNSIALIFISVSLLRSVYISSGDISIKGFLHAAVAFNDLRIIIIVLLAMYSILLSMISFFHWLPERLAFFMMNSIPINVTAYVVIVLVNSDIPLDRHTLFAGVVIFLVVYAVAMIFRSIIPQSLESRVHLLESRKHMLDSNAKRFRDLARLAGGSHRRDRLESRSVRFQKRSDEIDERIKALKREL
ncbi:hypothetical protein JW898_02120 [Candidatus Woesearchaeota archaeon]|nr:hypothetical protein [Candidatus Woesearchaeota archaeon]